MKSRFSERVKEKIEQIENQDIKDYFKIRYLNVLQNLEKNTFKSCFFYYFFSINITFGSLLTPPLLTINKRESEEYFWTLFTISIIITTSNALIKLFHLDKIYITRNIRLNQFKTEGLYFLTKVEPYNEADQDKNFKLFVKNIEKLKREQIAEEYTQNRKENRDDYLEGIPITSV